MPFGWGIRRPPPIRQVRGISAPEITLQNRWHRTSHLQSVVETIPRRSRQYWYFRIVRINLRPGSQNRPGISLLQSGISALMMGSSAVIHDPNRGKLRGGTTLLSGTPNEATAINPDPL